VGAFLVMFFLALATWLLIRSMVGHLRKVRYAAEAAERAAAEPGAAGDLPVDGGPGAAPTAAPKVAASKAAAPKAAAPTKTTEAGRKRSPR
jgi:hypothetical protein